MMKSVIIILFSSLIMAMTMTAYASTCSADDDGEVELIHEGLVLKGFANKCNGSIMPVYKRGGAISPSEVKVEEQVGVLVDHFCRKANPDVKKRFIKGGYPQKTINSFALVFQCLGGDFEDGIGHVINTLEILRENGEEITPPCIPEDEK
jgi:hypothetical protein